MMIKKTQSIDSIETYASGMSKDLIWEKGETKCISITKQYKIFNFNYITKEDIKEHNRKWADIPHHLYWILIIGDCGSGKTNALLNLINHEPIIDHIYLYAEDRYEAKHQLLINKKESTSLTYLNDSKAFIEYSNDMEDIYKHIEEFNPNKKWKTLIVFDDMIASMFNNKNLIPIVTELSIRSRKTNISLVFITILFCCSKKYQTQFKALIYYENS